MITFEPNAAVNRRFCGRCQTWLPSGIALHECVKAPQVHAYEWQCPACKAWYAPDASKPGHGHVCTGVKSTLRAVTKVRKAEPLLVPPVSVESNAESNKSNGESNRFDRKAYQRDLMRRRRADGKADK